MKIKTNPMEPPPLYPRCICCSILQQQAGYRKLLLEVGTAFTLPWTKISNVLHRSVTFFGYKKIPAVVVAIPQTIKNISQKTNYDATKRTPFPPSSVRHWSFYICMCYDSRHLYVWNWISIAAFILQRCLYYLYITHGDGSLLAV